ncbi:MAG: CdaR family protein [Candidatus Dormibacteria bacterium]
MRFAPGFVTRNLGLKVLATALAVVTWAGVVYAANPPGIRTILMTVPQDSTILPPGFVLTHPLADIPVRIAGTADHLNSFERSSLQLKVHYERITQPGAYDIPIDLHNSDPSVELDRPPTTVAVDTDKLDTMSLAVQVVPAPGPPAGYAIGTEVADPAKVTVTGPHSELTGIKAMVMVNLSNQKANYERGGEIVFLADAQGRRVQDVHAEPPTVGVLITIVANTTARVSAVVPPIRGVVAPGYQLGGIRVEPATVTLTGPQDILNADDMVSTDPVNVGGLTADRTFTVTVKKPQDGVTVSFERITVRVTVTALPTPAPTPTQTATPSPPSSSPSPSPTPP